MQGRYFDGRSARPYDVVVAAQGGELAGQGEGVSFRWPLAEVDLLDEDQGRVRLGRRSSDERLVLDAAEWETVGGGSLKTVRRAAGRRERRLVVALTVAGVAVGLAVFVGIPAASGPLAKATPPNLEAQMGDNMAGQLKLGLRPCDGQVGQAALQAASERLAAHADMPFDIKVTAVRAPLVNAFALPGGTILVTDDLIQLADTPDELMAVVAHEIAHVEKRHAMQAAWRSMGVGLVLDAVVGGGTGAGQQAVLLFGGFTEQRFSRQLEREADDRAMQLLAAEGVSTRGMADFFDRLADHKSSRQARDVVEWFSSHPDTGRRSQAARAAAKPGQPAMSALEWSAVRRACAKAPKA